MAEDSKRNIPIEDGSEKPDETEANEAEMKESEAEKEAEAEEEAEAGPGATAEERKSSEGGNEAESEPNADGETGEKEAFEEENSPEEAESERYMRLMAEFQNFKRRAAKEKSDIHAFANERIINDLLPVLDNFERALGGGAEGAGAEVPKMSEEVANYAKGIELIFGQLKTALEKAGLKEIEALGEDFDPNVHNAVMTEQTDDYEDGKVSKVMQKGYKLNDRVIRPSMVGVNKK